MKLLKLRDIYNKKPLLVLITFSIILGLITVLFGSQLSSLLYPMASTNKYVHDASMFYYMGELFQKGYTPYTEVFDHKGLYLFYYVGLGLVFGKVGLFIVQSLTFSVFYLFLIKTLLIYLKDKRQSIWIVLITLIILIITHQSPSDFEIVFPFIMVSIYFYIKAMKNGDDKQYYYGNLFTGISAGISLNLRASDAMVPLAMVIFFIVNQIRKKDGKSILCNGLICFGAFLLTCLPPLIHSLIGGFTSLMYESIIVSNFKYVGSTNGIDDKKIVAQIIVAIIFLILILGAILLRKKNSKEENLFYLISFGILFVIQFIIAYYPHYVLICIPLFLTFLASVLNCLKIHKFVRISVNAVLSLTLLGSMLFFPINYYINQRSVDIAINEYVNEVISKEEKKGHVLCYYTSSSIYINADIEVSYADFGCQINHVDLSKEYSLDNLIAYSKSETCHYLIIENVEHKDDAFYDWLSVDAVNENIYKLHVSTHEGSQYISIYEKA